MQSQFWRFGRFWCVGALAALALTLTGAPRSGHAEEAVRCETIASIGVARMSEDGVITLRIRSLPPGPVAEGEFRYSPGDPRYEEIKKHLGGIAPGETKPVPPWC
jgi:hypothetical protein